MSFKSAFKIIVGYPFRNNFFKHPRPFLDTSLQVLDCSPVMIDTCINAANQYLVFQYQLFHNVTGKYSHWAMARWDTGSDIDTIHRERIEQFNLKFRDTC